MSTSEASMSFGSFVRTVLDALEAANVTFVTLQALSWTWDKTWTLPILTGGPSSLTWPIHGGKSKPELQSAAQDSLDLRRRQCHL